LEASLITSAATLAIIAGGVGQRLGGVPKGLLVHQGRTLIERLLDLRHNFVEVLLVSGDRAYQSYGLRTTSDLVPGRGAPGGVHAALAKANTPWVVAIGCDMPFVSPGAVQILLKARAARTDWVCFEIAGRLEPLLGVYRSAIAPKWGRLLASQPSFAELSRRFRTDVLPEHRLQEVDPELRSVVSLNTPEDLQRFGVSLPTL
jgi:molybdopterin-guanine dinucleotide biosynthesis protein A